MCCHASPVPPPIPLSTSSNVHRHAPSPCGRTGLPARLQQLDLLLRSQFGKWHPEPGTGLGVERLQFAAKAFCELWAGARRRSIVASTPASTAPGYPCGNDRITGAVKHSSSVAFRKFACPTAGAGAAIAAIVTSTSRRVCSRLPPFSGARTRLELLLLEIDSQVARVITPERIGPPFSASGTSIPNRRTRCAPPESRGNLRSVAKLRNRRRSAGSPCYSPARNRGSIHAAHDHHVVVCRPRSPSSTTWWCNLSCGPRSGAPSVPSRPA